MSALLRLWIDRTFVVWQYCVYVGIHCMTIADCIGIQWCLTGSTVCESNLNQVYIVRKSGTYLAIRLIWFGFPVKFVWVWQFIMCNFLQIFRQSSSNLPSFLLAKQREGGWALLLTVVFCNMTNILLANREFCYHQWTDNCFGNFYLGSHSLW